MPGYFFNKLILCSISSAEVKNELELFLLSP